MNSSVESFRLTGVCLLSLHKSFCPFLVSRICNLLDALCNVTDRPTFFCALWRCILGSSEYRLPAVNLLLGKLNKRLTAEDQVHCMGGNLPLVVSGAAS